MYAIRIITNTIAVAIPLGIVYFIWLFAMSRIITLFP